MLLKQSTARNVTFLMVLSSDHVSPATGKTVTVTLSKDSGTFGAAAGTVTEIANGWYCVALTTTDTNTLGDLSIHCTAASCDNTDIVRQVVVDLPGGTVSSVTGSVGSVTGSVGSVTGAVGSVTGAVVLPAIPANWITAAGINAAALNGKGDWLLASSYTTPPTAAAIATAVWQDATAGDFTVASSIGKSLYTNGNAPGAASGLALVGSNMGSVTTATNLTNLPSIPANWITAAGIAASALNGKGDWLLASNVPANFAALGISVSGHISNVDTLTTYTGNTVQTGDSYARLGAPAGASIAADISTRSAPATPQTINMTTAVPTSNTAQTVGDALNAARAQGFGKWGLVGTTLTLYAADNVTVVRTFTLDSSSSPTSRA